MYTISKNEKIELCVKQMHDEHFWGCAEPRESGTPKLNDALTQYQNPRMDPDGPN